MPPLAALLATNSTLRTKLPALVAVIVGATAGIGEATALKLASLTAKPTLCLVGRSKTSADRIIELLNKINENGIYAFHPCDVSSVADVRRVSADLKSNLPKINFLVMTPGILTTKGRDETPEGNDKKLMLHYYGRMLFARELAPLLIKGAADSGGSSVQTSKVLSVLDAVNGNAEKLIMDDLDLKQNYSLRNATNHACAMNDAAVQHLSTLYPSVTFIHMAPGVVKTNLGHNLPLYFRLLMRLALFFAAKPEDCAERLVYALAEDDIQGWALLDRFGDRVKGKLEMLSEGIRRKVWEHTETIVGK